MGISFPPWPWPAPWRQGTGPGAVELVGSRRGLDAQLLAGEGLPVTAAPGPGHRPASRRPLAAWPTWGRLAGLVAAFVAAVVVVRPSPARGGGGHGRLRAACPTALAAAVLGVPVVLVNVDAVPGAANRLVGRFARAAAVAFEGTALPRAVVTGAPVRAAIVAAAHPDAAGAGRRPGEALGLPADRLVVAAVGGSLGSKTTQRGRLGLAELWAARGDVALYHVVGRRDWPWASRRRRGRHRGRRRRAVLRPGPLRGADGALLPGGRHRGGPGRRQHRGRAGRDGGARHPRAPARARPATTRRANAGVLERAGAAVVVPDAECTGPRLADEIDALASDPDRLRRHGRRRPAPSGAPTPWPPWRRWPGPMPARPRAGRRAAHAR